MNAVSPIHADPAAPEPTELAPGRLAPDEAVAAAAAHPQSASRRQRHDGWTPDRQRLFLESIADGHTTEDACRLAGMSPSSAYAFRRRAAGAAFDLGWRAASLLAREHVADALLARAIHGQRETITRPNGDVIERHRFDNRLAGQMLARLDRMAEASDPGSAAANASARLVAQEFDGYLDLIERDAGPARAGLFVAARDPALLGGGATDADLAPVLGLARADRYLRTGVGGAGEVATHDLDPAARATWTAEQWTRAEAAGIVALAPPAPEPEEPASSSPLSPLHPGGTGKNGEPGRSWRDRIADLDPNWVEPGHVWFDEEDEDFLTNFPPPDDWEGDEEGEFGDVFYARTLSDAEWRIADRVRGAETEAQRRKMAAERDAYFAVLAEEGDDGGDG